ncbi:hypothetical protein JMG10_34020 [Nostoc ellipsosporum NOK]|nr:hypothetical protein [Nostoc ellipsosporum NOK]
MKCFLLISMSILLSTVITKAQVSVEIDKFTKEKKIITEWAPLDRGFASSAQISFRSVDSFLFATIACDGVYADVIGTKHELIFLLDNGDTISVWSPSIQSYDIGYYATKSARHSYVINKEQIAKLASQNLIVSFRKYGSNGYADGTAKSKNAIKVQKLADAFLKAL